MREEEIQQNQRVNITITHKILLVLLIVMGGFLFGCKNTEESRVSKAREIGTNITYVRDKRTNLCFAIFIRWAAIRGFGFMAHVPCDKVKKYLVN